VSPNRLPSRTRDWAVALLWGVCALVFHHWGNTTGLYVRYDWFQVAAHFWSATAMALILVVTARTLHLDGGRAVLFVVVFSAVGALGWELVEYLGIFENLHFWGFRDSFIDLVADTIGVSMVLGLGSLLRRIGRVPAIAGDLSDRLGGQETSGRPEAQSVPSGVVEQSD
jgi:hypothetical protein